MFIIWKQFKQHYNLKNKKNPITHIQLSDYRIIFASICTIGILLLASPLIVEVIPSPNGETFSELYLLGPEKTAQNLPFNIIPGQNYSIYLGVGNYMGTSTYYICNVKLRNQTEPAPNSDTQTASSQPTLYEYRTVIQNNKNSTIPLNFSISTTSPAENLTLLQSITINNIEFNVNKLTRYDPDNNGYYYQLFVELWAYNPNVSITQYQNRYVYLWLNTTLPATHNLS
ncbi:MAG: DUF1616 domain-containing protein [Nitrososphaerota archaeon]|jgi:uncharacterized membrane protein|nr:DUF1616 domain-containing protein [Nitrososphaerota archaeon]